MTMKVRKIAFTTSLYIVTLQTFGQGWEADLKNGKYKNPILHVDYSDPDVCIGKDAFYMAASSFHNSPGLPILQSKDLVNWELINYALQNQVPVEHYQQVRHGCGVWAPSIRYHNGEYFIFWGDPDFGIYMVKTNDPKNIWEKPVLVKKAKGIIDTCPFWDEDGKAYLSYAFAGSRAGVKSVIMLSEMSPDGTKLIGNPAMVFDGHNGHTTVEGSKMYKRDGYYWIMAPAGGVKPGWQLAMRSKNVWGPYEYKVVLHQGNTTINGPHQGGYIETPNGNGWFIHFQDRWAYGRVVYLEPVIWKNGWPIIGQDKDNDGVGEPVTEWVKPDVGKDYPASPLVSSDEFNGYKYGLQWQWQANPNEEEQWGWISGNLGFMRLNCIHRDEEQKSMWMMPNLFMQKFPGQSFTATTKLTFNNNPDAEECRSGLLVFGEDYSYIAIEQDKNGYLRLVQRTLIDASSPEENEIEIASVPLEKNSLYFRAKIEMIKDIEPYDARTTFYYSLDNKKYKKFGETFTPRAGRWVGSKIGIFATGSKRVNDCSYADYDWFRVSNKIDNSYD